MLIKPKVNMYFTGAKSGKKMRLERNVVTEIAKEDLVHVDPNDYKIRKSGTPGETIVDPEDLPKKKVWLRPKAMNAMDYDD